tara:strand:+ start:2929 stop:3837 length:909 start_codon:yes stop_codon:yes gene_type:complete
MIIKREQFLEELHLREQIRKIIKVVKAKKKLTEQREEEQLRLVIRQLISEQDEMEAVGDPSRATGINILEEVLDNIVEIFETYYKKLTSSREQRDSFRVHILNAVENLIKPLKASADAGNSETLLQAPPENEEVPVSEQLELDIGEPTGAPQEDPRFIDVRGKSKKPTEEDTLEAEKAEFRRGLEGDLTDDQETGALRAQAAFNGPDSTIKNAYKDLRGEDAELFYEYLITNLKLHFDAFEEEMGNPEEPTTPSYEEQAGLGAGGPPMEDELPPPPGLEAPPGLEPPPEEEGMPPLPPPPGL